MSGVGSTTFALIVISTLSFSHVNAGPFLRWGPEGIPICTVPGTQPNADLAGDGSQGAFFAWADRRNGTDLDIYALRVNADGTRGSGWIQDGSPMCVLAGDQGYARVVTDGSGGAFILWLDGVVHAQHVLHDGTIAPGWPTNGRPIIAGTNHEGFQPVSDSEGGFLVTWVNHPERHVYAIRIGPDGNTASGWPAGGVRVSDGSPYGTYCRIVAAPNGNAYVAYHYRDEPCIGHGCPPFTYQHIVTKHVTKDGAVLIAGGSHEYYDLPSLGSDGFGGVISAYCGWRDLRASRFDSDGTGRWSAYVAAGPGSFGTFAIVPDGQGGALFGWDEDEIRLIRIGATGAVSSGWPGNGLLVGASSDATFSPQMITDATGGVYVAWTDDRSDAGDVYASRITADGALAPGWTAGGDPILVAGDYQACWPLIPDGAGGAILGWTDFRGSSYGLFAQRIVPEPPVPITGTVATTDVTTERVSLSWYVPLSANESFEIERAEPGEEWASLGSAAASSNDRVQFVDRDIQPGLSYGYRLATRAGAFGEVWVEIPRISRLALDVTWADPTADAVRFEIGLPDAGQPTVELYDVSGRRVLEQHLPWLDSGRHSVEVALSRLDSGVYFARLQLAGQSARTRVFVVR